MAIHPTAMIDSTAELASTVDIGAHVIIGPHVRINENTVVHANAQIIKYTEIGSDCHIHPFSVIGGDPQDLKYRGEETWLRIGNKTEIREFTSINRGTVGGGCETVIGSNCMVMAYVHIEHDCIVGNNVILTNLVQLAGHIKVEDFAILSGMVLVHHFVTIGTHAFIAPCSGLRVDAPPYIISEGTPARVRKVNVEGLRRRGMPAESIQALRSAVKILYRISDSETEEVSQSIQTKQEAILQIESEPIGQDPHVKVLLDHVKASINGSQGRALEAHRQR